MNVGVGNGRVGADIDFEGEGVGCIVGCTKLDVVLRQCVTVVEVVGAGLRAAVIFAAGVAGGVKADALFAV